MSNVWPIPYLISDKVAPISSVYLPCMFPLPHPSSDFALLSCPPSSSSSLETTIFLYATSFSFPPLSPLLVLFRLSDQICRRLITKKDQNRTHPFCQRTVKKESFLCETKSFLTGNSTEGHVDAASAIVQFPEFPLSLE